MSAYLLHAIPIFLAGLAIFLAGLGCGLILAAFMGPPKRRRWRDLPPFITKD